jgi:hypothetical protein
VAEHAFHPGGPVLPARAISVVLADGEVVLKSDQVAGWPERQVPAREEGVTWTPEGEDEVQ